MKEFLMLIIGSILQILMPFNQMESSYETHCCTLRSAQEVF